MSTPITVTVPHKLGAAEARQRLDEGFHKIAAQLGGGGLAKIEKHWEGERLMFRAQALGQTVTGHMDIFPEHVRMEVLLPGLLGMLASKVQNALQSSGRLLLEKK